MPEVLRQGRRNPVLIHEGPEPVSGEDTTPIVGMATDGARAQTMVAAVNGTLIGQRGDGVFRVGRRYDTTVYWEPNGADAVFWAWFPDPSWAARVVAALNGEGGQST